MAPSRVFVLTLGLALFHCFAEQEPTCGADGVCADAATHASEADVQGGDDAESMKVSLLQRRSMGAQDQGVLQDAAEAQEQEALYGRKAELLVQLAEIEEELQQLAEEKEEAAAKASGESGWQWGTANCQQYGCNYQRGRNCQCNDVCDKYNSCCNDYAAVCKPTPRPTAPPQSPTPATSPTHATAGSVAGVFGHPSASIDYPKYDGFTLMLAEEFDEALDLDTDPLWTWSDGGLREGEVRFVKEQVKFKDGKMIVEAAKYTGWPKTQPCSHASVEVIPHKPLISGEIRSRHNMFRYGRYEVRMKAPEVQPGNSYVNGNFISTMFVYRDANAHHWREIDFEITGDGPASLTTNLLYADGTKNWRPFLQDSRRPNLGNVNVRRDFHTYAFEWTPKGVIWFVDGRKVREGSHLKVPERSTKVMMNLWIFTGGNFGGHSIGNNRYPMHSEYDWFRFYKWDGDDRYPCKDMGTSCLEKDDFYLSANNPCDGIKQEGLLEGKPVCTVRCPH